MIHRDTTSIQKNTKHPTEPSKIDANLFSKIFPDVVKWLVFVPPTPTCPVLVQDLTRVQF